MSLASSFLFADWPAPAKVHACTTLRCDAGVSKPPFDRFNLGARSGDDAQAVAANRAALRERLRLPSEPRWLRQAHGAQVVRDPAADESEADAAVTSEADVVLAILTADCLPVLLCSQDGGEIAAAHAGWRGLVAGVLENAVAAMRTPPTRLLAWLGPAAGPDAYEVGAEVRDAFVAREAQAATAFTATQPGHWHCDLYALARRRLAALGIARVHGGGLCTICDTERFYSYRRDARTGRMATLIWRDPV